MCVGLYKLPPDSLIQTCTQSKERSGKRAILAQIYSLLSSTTWPGSAVCFPCSSARSFLPPTPQPSSAVIYIAWSIEFSLGSLCRSPNGSRRRRKRNFAICSVLATASSARVVDGALQTPAVDPHTVGLLDNGDRSAQADKNSLLPGERQQRTLDCCMPLTREYPAAAAVRKLQLPAAPRSGAGLIHFLACWRRGKAAVRAEFLFVARLCKVRRRLQHTVAIGPRSRSLLLLPGYYVRHRSRRKQTSR